MSALTIAETRSRKSRSSAAFMAAYAKGRECAASGEEPPRMTGKSATYIAGFIEGVASWRAQTATPRDYMGHSGRQAADHR
jgi:hypothetical protein